MKDQKFEDGALKDYLKKYPNIPVGEIFKVQDKEYMFVTWMIVECLSTNESHVYMRGIDF